MTLDIADAEGAAGAAARRRHRSVPIAILLGASLGALVLVAAVSVLVISIWSGVESTIDQLENQAVMAVNTIEQRLDDHLSPAVEQVRFVHDLMVTGRLDPADDGRLEDVLTGTVAATPQVDGIVFIDRRLMMRGVGRSGGGAFWVKIDQSAHPGYRHAWNTTGQGPRSAYWLGLLWSPELYETVAVVHQPVHVDGEFVGMLSAGVAVSKLSRFVAGFESEVEGQTFILRGEKEVIAHPALVEGFEELAPDKPLPRIDELADPVLAAMWQHDRIGSESTRRPATMDGHTVEVDGETWYFLYRTIESYGPEPWIVGNYFRGSDLESEFERLEWAGIVGLCVVLAGVLTAFFIGRWIANPVRRLAFTAQRIGTLEFDTIEALGPSRLRELDEAAGAFNLMLRGLRWFESYVPRKLVRRLIGFERDAVFQSEEREVTVMFTDIAGFTQFAVGLPPAATAAFLNRHFALLTECVEAEGGTVDKYIGDALMAFWGAPERQPDHALRAYRAARAIATVIERDNRARASEGEAPVRLRIGLHSGPAVVGNIGAPDRINYTIVGDTVNICQRIEQLGKTLDPGDRDVVAHVSGATRRRLGEGVALTNCGARPLRGRSGDVEIHRID